MHHETHTTSQPPRLTQGKVTVSPHNVPMFISQSSFLQEKIAEAKQISILKWLESEKAGHDVGYHYSLLKWIRHHQKDWQKNYRKHKEDK